MKETRYIVEEIFQSDDAEQRVQHLKALLETYLKALQNRLLQSDEG